MKDKKKKKKKHKRKAQEFIPYPVLPVYSQQSVVSSRQSGSTESSAENPATSNKQQAIENMEVHKHPHHVMHKKRWPEYLLEFLMLFLAVFLGFLAENVREHYIEQKRAKVFAAAMINDLASDTADLKAYIKYMTYAANNVDTLSQLLSANKPNEIPSGKLYWYGLWGGAPRFFIPNDATFQQMKSSGSLRYFTNKSLGQKVVQYDLLCRKMKAFEESDMIMHIEVRKKRAQIFEFRYNMVANSIYQSNTETPDHKKIDSFILTNSPLLTYDKTVFNEYIELVRSRFLSNKVRTADTLLVHARDLITQLRKEYHPE
jgi:hypothetical protein